MQGGELGQKGAQEQVAAPSRVLSRVNHYTANGLMTLVVFFFFSISEGKAVKVSPG